MSLSKIQSLRNSYRKSAIQQEILPQPDPVLKPTRDTSISNRSHSLNCEKIGINDILTTQRRIQQLERQIQDCEFERQANKVYNNQFKTLGRLLGNSQMEFEELKEKIEELVLNQNQGFSKIKSYVSPEESLGTSLAEKNRLVEIQQRNEEFQNQIKQLSVTIERKEEELYNFRKKVEEYEYEYRKVTEEKQKQKTEITKEAQSIMQEKNKYINELTDQLEKMSITFKEQGEIASEKALLAKNNEELIQQVKGLQNSIQIYQTNIERMERELMSFQSQKQEQIEQATTELKTYYEKEIKGLYDELNETKKIKDSEEEYFVTKINDQTNQISGYKSALDQLAQENQDLEKNIQSYKNEILSLQQEARTSFTQVKETSLIVKDLEIQLDEQKSEFQEQLSAKEEKYKKLVNKIAEMEKEMGERDEKESQKYKELEGIIEEKDLQIQYIQTQYNKAQNEKQKSQNELMYITKEYEELTNNFNDFKQEKVQQQKHNSLFLQIRQAQETNLSLKVQQLSNQRNLLQKLHESCEQKIQKIQLELEEKDKKILALEGKIGESDKQKGKLLGRISEFEIEFANKEESIKILEKQYHEMTSKEGKIQEFLNDKEIIIEELRAKMNQIQVNFETREQNYVSQIKLLQQQGSQLSNQIFSKDKEMEQLSLGFDNSIEKMKSTEMKLQNEKNQLKIYIREIEEEKQKIIKKFELLLEKIQKIMIKYGKKEKPQIMISSQKIREDLQIFKDALSEYGYNQAQNETEPSMNQISSMSAGIKGSDSKENKEGYQYQMKPSFDKQSQNYEPIIKQTLQKEESAKKNENSEGRNISSNQGNQSQQNLSESLWQSEKQKNEKNLSISKKEFNDISSFEEALETSKHENKSPYQQIIECQSEKIIENRKASEYKSEEIIRQSHSRIEIVPNRIEEKHNEEQDYSEKSIVKSEKSFIKSEKSSKRQSQASKHQQIELQNNQGQSKKSFTKSIVKVPSTSNPQNVTIIRNSKQVQIEKGKYPPPSRVVTIEHPQVVKSSMINQLKDIQQSKKQSNVPQISQKKISYLSPNAKNVQKIYFRLQSPDNSQRKVPVNSSVQKKSTHKQEIRDNQDRPTGQGALYKRVLESQKYSNLPVTNTTVVRNQNQQSNFTFRNKNHHSPSPNTSIKHQSPSHLQQPPQVPVSKEKSLNKIQDKIIKNVPFSPQNKLLMPHRQIVTYRQVSPQEREMLRKNSPNMVSSPNASNGQIRYVSISEKDRSKRSSIKFQTTRSPNYKYNNRPATKTGHVPQQVNINQEYYGLKTKQQEKRQEQKRILNSQYKVVEGLSENSSGISGEQKEGQCCPNCWSL